METFMDEAFMEARHALAVGEVPVGCVFVWDNEIIARSRNYVNATKNATRHAEFISVVVTVEPCIMCSAALHTLGVKEILYGCANDRFGGKTVVNVAEVVGTNLPIRGGIRAAEAMDLLKEFYKGVNPSAPVPNTRK
ncbi:tRNA-specific adenosine deaminase 2-like isoform X2 [Teleopsis dalmanni]|uniref:tRNA-specific adenosine deaminase 2-like isoform X2 n=1 Tax=Teleopsis dalmanni TaxID=139649 RepID=UPI0018CD3FC4|nr:tRNA-specific adenosine deaminase 2-like isoform X2 [Teleopsis dalmanni]XP_037952279.1 tRNA-specific adenosine deaminase 2-like isoform X2 [Teleopsis dalmanni]